MLFQKKRALPEKLNICFVAHKFHIQGRSTDNSFIWPIARGLVQQGHQVTIIASRGPKESQVIEKESVTIHFLGNDLRGLKDFPHKVHTKFEELHSIHPFDIVHSIDASGFRIGARKKRYKVAMSYDVKATHMAQIFRIMGMSQRTLRSLIKTDLRICYKFLITYFKKDRRLLKTADAIFVTSPFQKVVLERYYMFPEYRTFLLPYGIDVSDSTERKGTELLRNKLDLPKNARTIVTLTDMTELEEVSNVLKAFEKLAIKKHSARLIIIGHGPLRKSVELETYNLALGSRVIFLGAVSDRDIGDYISLAHVFINISSRSTGFEPSLLEAMSQKKIIIGSEVGPMSTIVQDGSDGFLIRPADVLSLSSLLIKIFEEPAFTEQMGHQAHQKIKEIFDLSKMVTTTLSAYRQTMVRTGQHRAQ